ncbi:uncharacterized protein LOC125500655 [Athalia rosae]|uniref:uncharacterized protein LOC125500655 n=1 Tax=Athalia rosae TaxID=37344 RepID=UPI0020344AE7|nr:uncharacterized protein LOC125500655 [Athalia rosae]
MEKKRYGEFKGNLTKKSLRPHAVHGNCGEATISRQNTGESHVARRKGLIAQLMRTTTRDPTKKNPGDQGVEYSEYYSDNDILLPEIREPLKLSENARDLKERMRSIQDSEGDDFMDQNYYDLSDDSEAFQTAVERAKRNDQKTVEVMEAPANFMEYVDSSYRPVQMHGIGENDGIPKYIANRNYIRDRRVNVAYNPVGDPSVEVVAPRPVTNNEFFPTNMRYGNSQFVKNPAPMLNMNPSMNVPVPIQQFYPVKSKPPYYSVGDLPPANSLGFSISTSLGKPLNGTGPMDYVIPDNEKLSKFGDASSAAIREPFQDIRGAFGSATPASRGSSAALELSKNYFATFKATPSLIDSASRLLNSGVQDIKLNLGAPEVEYLNHRAPDHPTSHEKNPRGSGAVKKSKRKESDSTKTVEETSPATTESSDSKKQADETSSPTTESSSVKSQTEHAPSSTTESSSVKNRTVCKTTKSADHNSLATTSSQALVNVNSSVSGPANSTISGNSTVSANTTVSENTTIAVNQTRVVASQILSEIMGELEEMRLENPKDEQKEGLPCKLTGSWVTTKAGVRIDMKVTNHSINVSLDYLTPPITTEGLLNVTWNATGFAPFKRGGPFTLIATNNHTKTLAVFVGACKVCQGIDTIEGTWTVSREPRDCRDFQMSTNIFNEIFRRTRLYSAIKDKQLKQLDEKNSSTGMTPVTNSSSSESSSTTHEGLMTPEKSHNETLRLNGTFK